MRNAKSTSSSMLWYPILYLICTTIIGAVCYLGSAVFTTTTATPAPMARRNRQLSSLFGSTSRSASSSAGRDDGTVRRWRLGRPASPSLNLQSRNDIDSRCTTIQHSTLTRWLGLDRRLEDVDIQLESADMWITYLRLSLRYIDAGLVHLQGYIRQARVQLRVVSARSEVVLLEFVRWCVAQQQQQQQGDVDSTTARNVVELVDDGDENDQPWRALRISDVRDTSDGSRSDGASTRSSTKGKWSNWKLNGPRGRRPKSAG